MEPGKGKEGKLCSHDRAGRSLFIQTPVSWGWAKFPGPPKNLIWSVAHFFFFFACLLYSGLLSPSFFSLLYSFYVIWGCRSLVFHRILFKILLASGRQRMARVRKAMKQKSWIIPIIWVFLGNVYISGVFLPLKFAFTQWNRACVYFCKESDDIFCFCMLHGISASKKFLVNREAVAWGPRLENKNSTGKKVF